MEYSWSRLFNGLCFLSFLAVSGNLIWSIIAAIRSKPRDPFDKRSETRWSRTQEFLEDGLLVWFCPVIVLVLLATPFYLLYLLYRALRAIIG